jgi:predicted dehydrogenase
VEDAITDDRVEVVYVASNHATHAEYSALALEHGKAVYVEKPVAVSSAQFGLLASAVQRHPQAIYAGYNRPFSPAIRELKQLCPAVPSPLTFSCLVSGHRIPPDHWYRDPAEGTRVCGNIGHWLDLLVHVLCWGDLPDEWDITVVWSDPAARDDDLAITLTSARGDLANIVLTARTEPFEGINESIAIQWGNCIAKIDNFQTMTVWLEQNKIHRRYWPKDAGHKQAILQPWSRHYRQWSEVEMSSLLMLKIAGMVRSSIRTSRFSFAEMRSSLRTDRK